MSRLGLTLGDKVGILLRQAHCPLCGAMLGRGKIEWDHELALARGGHDHPSNIRAVHKACHDKKTRGNGATTLGSDIGEIAKTSRLEEIRLHGPRKPKVIMAGSLASGWTKPMRGPARRR
jgi:hypothetical protein